MEMAEGGTLFMDEIANSTSSLSGKLLHVLQDGHFTALATTKKSAWERVWSVPRTVSCTAKLESATFRADLFIVLM